MKCFVHGERLTVFRSSHACAGDPGVGGEDVSGGRWASWVSRDLSTMVPLLCAVQ